MEQRAWHSLWQTHGLLFVLTLLVVTEAKSCQIYIALNTTELQNV